MQEQSYPEKEPEPSAKDLFNFVLWSVIALATAIAIIAAGGGIFALWALLPARIAWGALFGDRDEGTDTRDSMNEWRGKVREYETDPNYSNLGGNIWHKAPDTTPPD